MATSMKHVRESQGIEAPAQQIESSFLYDTPTPAAPPEQHYILFRLVRKKQRALNVDGICDNVLNPTTGKHERIWLLRGASSIWTSELTEQLRDRDTVNRNRLSLRFVDGLLRIPSNMPVMLEYARVNTNNCGKRRNGAGKRDYYEYDAAEEQKMRHDDRMKRINLLQAIGTMEEKKMVKLAMFVGVSQTDEEVGLPRLPDGYRTELSLKADKDPDTILKFMGKPEVEISYAVRQSIIESKIDLGGATGNVIWAGNGGFICKLPQGRKPVEYLTELAMTNSKEGRQFKEQLETIAT